MPIDNAVEQLMLLKTLLETTGALHDAQILQLEGWAKVAYPAKSVELRIDIPSKICEFHLKMKPKAKIKSQAKKREWMQKGVKWLLGDLWSIKIYNGTKRL